VLKAADLTVRYAGMPPALDAVSLALKPGVFGLLGPNGAGKSTLLRVLATLQRPDSGSIQFADDEGAFDVLREPQRMRRTLGYLPQDFGLYPSLSVEYVLGHFCALKGASEREERVAWAESLLRRTNLLEKRRATVSSLSGGMRQRLGLAIALAGSPSLLLLDEPTAGLDPGERRRIYDVLAQLGERTVVLLSTHLTEDIRVACTRFAILNRGRIVTEHEPALALRALRESLGADATLEDLYFQHVPLDAER
jgi:ABC-type multidrug transport system ATPase subunit